MDPFLPVKTVSTLVNRWYKELMKLVSNIVF